jgi:hypothetical protein
MSTIEYIILDALQSAIDRGHSEITLTQYLARELTDAGMVVDDEPAQFASIQHRGTVH